MLTKLFLCTILTKLVQETTMTTVAYQFGSKAKYRITLELECFEDFNPHQLNWEKMLELEGSENVSAYTEDLTRPDQW